MAVVLPGQESGESPESRVPMDGRRPAIGSSRMQLVVVVLMLVLSLGWIATYAAVLSAGVGPKHVSPETAARLADEHANELKQLQFQMSELYAGSPPEVAGS